MTPSPVNKTLHDIVFENRNKAYGVYLLHTTSVKRLKNSLVLAVFLFLLLIGLMHAGMLIMQSLEPVYQLPVVSVGVDNKIPTIFSSGLSAKTNKDAAKKTAPEKAVTTPEELSLVKIEDNQATTENSEESSEIKAGNSSVPSAGAGVPWGSDEVFLAADVIPQFEGGREGLSKYLSLNVRYPEKAIDKQLHGTVMVCFVVTREGKVSDAKIVKGIDPLLDNEALRVVSMMPLWKPGLRNGHPVNIVLTIPIRFDLSLHFSGR